MVTNEGLKTTVNNKEILFNFAEPRIYWLIDAMVNLITTKKII